MDYICKCNNCGSFMYDENPQTDTPKIDISKVDVEIHPMELLNCNDEDGKIFRLGYTSFWGCGNCQTDDYLIDVKSIKEIITNGNYKQNQSQSID